jgi:NAD(P)-dependent dehydrogenase (short-subunit alcohol dehydrogenase family)
MLENKVAIVTGAAQGIGQAIAELFSNEGASIALCDINLKGIEEEKERLNNGSGPHRTYQVDVTNVEQIRKTVRKIVADYGHIDILVNSAGIFIRRDINNLTISDWKRMINVNVKSIFFFSQAVAKCCIELKRKGKIINVASISGEIVQAGKSHYAASKAAVIQLTKCMAIELAHCQINANIISPGPTITPQIAPVNPDDYLSRHHIPAGRMALPIDQAKGALFLASDLSDHVTGQVLNIDGGEAMTYMNPISK